MTRLAAQPSLAHVCVVEVLAAGPRALARRSAAMDRFRAFMLPGCEPLSTKLRTPEVAADALIGGIYEVIYAHVLRGETARLPSLAPELVDSMLAPFGHTRDGELKRRRAQQQPRAVTGARRAPRRCARCW